MSVPYILAPMATLSHRAFRELLEDFGSCDLYYSEMIGVAPFLHGGRFEGYYQDPLPRPDRLVYQIVGSEPEKLAKAAAILDARGVLGIDVNMGCSAPDITRSGAGVSWMRRPEEARAMIGRVRRSVKGRLSVKLRLGDAESFDSLVAFCRALQDEGVEHFTLHPRTASEKYRRPARWDYVGRLRAELAVPVAGNGDVDDPATLANRAAGPCDGVMVGRAAARAPWIFAAARSMERKSGVAAGIPRSEGAGAPTPSARDPERPADAIESAAPPAGSSGGGPGAGASPGTGRTEPVDLEAVASRFVDLLKRHQPPEFWETRGRRFFHYFCGNLTWANHVRTLVNRETSPDGMLAIFRAHIREVPEARWVAWPV